MPSYLKTIDFNELFHTSPIPPIIINDLPNRTEEDRAYFEYLVRSTFSTDMISALPRCFCGTEKGEHKIGKICENCGHPVKQSVEDDIAPSLWFRKPRGIEKLISPYFLILLRNQFNKRGVNIIDWLMNRNTPVPSNAPPIIHRMMADQVPRGYNNFVNNFDEIMKYLLASKDFPRDKFTTSVVAGMLGDDYVDVDPLEKLLKDNRECVFSDYIPIPNKMFIILEKTDAATYVEQSIFDIQNVVNTMLSIDLDHHDTRLSSIESRTAKILAMLSAYYEDYVISRMRPKKGHYRKHVYGGRGNHSFRAVITSHEAICDHDEIWIPWSVGVAVLWMHLVNYLSTGKYGRFTHNQIVSFLLAHIEKYHPLIDHLFKKIIRDSPNGYIAVMQQRNRYVAFYGNIVEKLLELLEPAKAVSPQASRKQMLTV